MSEHPRFGDWLQQTRRKRGISQERLAATTGIDRAHLSRIETGKVALPAHETRQRIHAALGTSEAELEELGIIRPVVAQVPTATAKMEAHPLAGVAVGTSTASGALSIGDEAILDVVMLGATKLTDAGRQKLIKQLQDIEREREELAGTGSEDAGTR